MPLSCSRMHSSEDLSDGSNGLLQNWQRLYQDFLESELAIEEALKPGSHLGTASHCHSSSSHDTHRRTSHHDIATAHPYWNSSNGGFKQDQLPQSMPTILSPQHYTQQDLYQSQQVEDYPPLVHELTFSDSRRVSETAAACLLREAGLERQEQEERARDRRRTAWANYEHTEQAAAVVSPPRRSSPTHPVHASRGRAGSVHYPQQPQHVPPAHSSHVNNSYGAIYHALPLSLAPSSQPSTAVEHQLRQKRPLSPIAGLPFGCQTPQEAEASSYSYHVHVPDVKLHGRDTQEHPRAARYTDVVKADSTKKGMQAQPPSANVQAQLRPRSPSPTQQQPGSSARRWLFPPDQEDPRSASRSPSPNRLDNGSYAELHTRRSVSPTSTGTASQPISHTEQPHSHRHPAHQQPVRASSRLTPVQDLFEILHTGLSPTRWRPKEVDPGAIGRGRLEESPSKRTPVFRTNSNRENKLTASGSSFGTGDRGLQPSSSSTGRSRSQAPPVDSSAAQSHVLRPGLLSLVASRRGSTPVDLTGTPPADATGALKAPVRNVQPAVGNGARPTVGKDASYAVQHSGQGRGRVAESLQHPSTAHSAVNRGRSVTPPQLHGSKSGPHRPASLFHTSVATNHGHMQSNGVRNGPSKSLDTSRAPFSTRPVSANRMQNDKRPHSARPTPPSGTYCSPHMQAFAAAYFAQSRTPARNSQITNLTQPSQQHHILSPQPQHGSSPLRSTSPRFVYFSPTEYRIFADGGTSESPARSPLQAQTQDILHPSADHLESTASLLSGPEIIEQPPHTTPVYSSFIAELRGETPHGRSVPTHLQHPPDATPARQTSPLHSSSSSHSPTSARGSTEAEPRRSVRKALSFQDPSVNLNGHSPTQLELDAEIAELAAIIASADAENNIQQHQPGAPPFWILPSGPVRPATHGSERGMLMSDTAGGSAQGGSVSRAQSSGGGAWVEGGLQGLVDHLMSMEKDSLDSVKGYASGYIDARCAQPQFQQVRSQKVKDAVMLMVETAAMDRCRAAGEAQLGITTQQDQQHLTPAQAESVEHATEAVAETGLVSEEFCRSTPSTPVSHLGTGERGSPPQARHTDDDSDVPKHRGSRASTATHTMHTSPEAVPLQGSTQPMTTSAPCTPSTTETAVWQQPFGSMSSLDAAAAGIVERPVWQVRSDGLDNITPLAVTSTMSMLVDNHQADHQPALSSNGRQVTHSNSAQEVPTIASAAGTTVHLPGVKKVEAVPGSQPRSVVVKHTLSVQAPSSPCSEVERGGASSEGCSALVIKILSQPLRAYVPSHIPNPASPTSPPITRTQSLSLPTVRESSSRADKPQPVCRGSSNSGSREQNVQGGKADARTDALLSRKTSPGQRKSYLALLPMRPLKLDRQNSVQPPEAHAATAGRSLQSSMSLNSHSSTHTEQQQSQQQQLLLQPDLGNHPTKSPQLMSDKQADSATSHHPPTAVNIRPPRPSEAHSTGMTLAQQLKATAEQLKGSAQQQLQQQQGQQEEQQQHTVTPISVTGFDAELLASRLRLEILEMEGAAASRALSAGQAETSNQAEAPEEVTSKHRPRSEINSDAAATAAPAPATAAAAAADAAAVTATAYSETGEEEEGRRTSASVEDGRAIVSIQPSTLGLLLPKSPSGTHHALITPTARLLQSGSLGSGRTNSPQFCSPQKQPASSTGAGRASWTISASPSVFDEHATAGTAAVASAVAAGVVQPEIHAVPYRSWSVMATISNHMASILDEQDVAVQASALSNLLPGYQSRPGMQGFSENATASTVEELQQPSSPAISDNDQCSSSSDGPHAAHALRHSVSSVVCAPPAKPALPDKCLVHTAIPGTIGLWETSSLPFMMRAHVLKRTTSLDAEQASPSSNGKALPGHSPSFLQHALAPGMTLGTAIRKLRPTQSVPSPASSWASTLHVYANPMFSLMAHVHRISDTSGLGSSGGGMLLPPALTDRELKFISDQRLQSGSSVASRQKQLPDAQFASAVKASGPIQANTGDDLTSDSSLVGSTQPLLEVRVASEKIPGRESFSAPPHLSQGSCNLNPDPLNLQEESAGAGIATSGSSMACDSSFVSSDQVSEGLPPPSTNPSIDSGPEAVLGRSSLGALKTAAGAYLAAKLLSPDVKQESSTLPAHLQITNPSLPVTQEMAPSSSGMSMHSPAVSTDGRPPSATPVSLMPYIQREVGEGAGSSSGGSSSGRSSGGSSKEARSIEPVLTEVRSLKLTIAASLASLNSSRLRPSLRSSNPEPTRSAAELEALSLHLPGQLARMDELLQQLEDFRVAAEKKQRPSDGAASSIVTQLRLLLQNLVRWRGTVVWPHSATSLSPALSKSFNIGSTSCPNPPEQQQQQSMSGSRCSAAQVPSTAVTAAANAGEQPQNIRPNVEQGVRVPSLVDFRAHTGAPAAASVSEAADNTQSSHQPGTTHSQAPHTGDQQDAQMLQADNRVGCLQSRGSPAGLSTTIASSVPAQQPGGHGPGTPSCPSSAPASPDADHSLQTRHGVHPTQNELSTSPSRPIGTEGHPSVREMASQINLQHQQQQQHVADRLSPLQSRSLSPTARQVLASRGVPPADGKLHDRISPVDVGAASLGSVGSSEGTRTSQSSLRKTLGNFLGFKKS